MSNEQPDRDGGGSQTDSGVQLGQLLEKLSRTQLEQMVEILLYAPLGLVYEYEEVIPRLVNRGRSQVELAKVLGRMAAGQTPKPSTDNLGASVTAGLSFLAHVANEVGMAAGFGSNAGPQTPAKAPPKSSTTEPAPESESHDDDGGRFPIDNFDDLSARVIVAELRALDSVDRAVVREYEMANKNRKTVLDRIRQLDKADSATDMED